MATALVSEQRAHRRSVTMLTANLTVANSSWPATIRNLSVQGALVQTAARLEIGAEVVLSRGSHNVAGAVRRRCSEGLGICFREAINVADWMQSIDTATMNRKGTREADGHAQAQTLAPETILSRVGEETAYISRLIEGVVSILAEDPILRVRHSSRIQELCMSEQMLQELGAILESDRSADAVQAYATGPMRQRLLRAPIVAVASCR